MPSKLANILILVSLKIRARLITHERLLLTAPRVFPFILGPVLYRFDTDVHTYVDAVKRFCSFLLLFGGWELLLRQTFSLRAARESANREGIERAKAEGSTKSKKSKKDARLSGGKLTHRPRKQTFPLSRKIALGANVIAVAVTLQIFRFYFEDAVFVIILAAFSCGVIGAFFEMPGTGSRPILALTPLLLYYILIGYLSCVSLTNTISIEPLVLAVSVSCAAIAPGIIRYLDRLTSLESERGHREREDALLKRSYALLVIFAPTSAAILVYADRVPGKFLALFVSLFVARKLLSSFAKKSADSTSVTSKDTHITAILTAYTYFGIFVVLPAL